MNILEQLNESQRQAVEYCDGASLVIAGAGSGKTRVLTHKVAYLIEIGYQPWSILALTFTNKAAGEMKQRIGKLVGEKKAAYLNMGTFHSVLARILRTEAAQLGFGANYTIYDESDSRALIKNIIKELQLDDTKYKPATVHNIISLAKNRLITAEMYEQDKSAIDRDQGEGRPLLYQIYSYYAQRCKMANVMDFDDLLLYAFLLFNEHEDVRKKYAERFKYVLVDEYQDTNYAQQQIVYLLTKEHRHVCVVGDDAQSIYSFRGANIENILGFQRLYEDAKLFKLERNYRSTQVIVNAANSLIKHNQWQIQKDVYSKNDEGECIQYQSLYSDKEEVVVVSKNILRIRREDGCSYDDFAILYRTNAQSRAFEEQLRKEGIPYRVFGGLSFYQRKEIKDIVAYFRLVVNPDDEEALRRVINYPARGIGNVTLNKVIDVARQEQCSIWQVLCSINDMPLKLSEAAKSKLIFFKELIEKFIQRMPIDDVHTLGVQIIKQTGIANEIATDSTPEGMARKENMDELLNYMKDFVDERKESGLNNEVFLPTFLQEVSLLTDLDGNEEELEEGRVSLMTVHSAKGLEFPNVFVVGLEENLFPSSMATNTMKELEEERRLLYVAITRAEKRCFLTSAQNRMRYGRPEFNAKSRFINDIDPRFLKTSSGASTAGTHWRSRRSDSDLWLQNSNPVGTQFRADPKPRMVPPRKPERPVDPFSEQFKKLQEQHGGRLKKVSATTPQSTVASSQTDMPGLREGCVIEHQRFGIGEVNKIEGSGENLKITVAFRNTGTKQLLVKFAKFKIIG